MGINIKMITYKYTFNKNNINFVCRKPEYILSLNIIGLNKNITPIFVANRFLMYDEAYNTYSVTISGDKKIYYFSLSTIDILIE